MRSYGFTRTEAFRVCAGLVRQTAVYTPRLEARPLDAPRGELSTALPGMQHVYARLHRTQRPAPTIAQPQVHAQHIHLQHKSIRVYKAQRPPRDRPGTLTVRVYQTGHTQTHANTHTHTYVLVRVLEAHRLGDAREERAPAYRAEACVLLGARARLRLREGARRRSEHCLGGSAWWVRQGGCREDCADA